jgi:hypothetical protein
MARTASRRRSSSASPSGAGERPSGSLSAPRRITTPSKTFSSQPVPIDFAGPDHRSNRIDLEIHGIFHGEASYEGRIFFNNPNADRNTPKTPENGYAGSFHILGHGGCLGDVGHCEVNEDSREPYDFRPPHPLTPAVKRVKVTRMLQDIAKTNKEVVITIVPVVTAANELCDTENVFRCEQMRFVSYNP